MRSHTGVEVTNDVSLLSRCIEITYLQQTFLAFIPVKLTVYEGIRGYARVCDGIRGYTRICDGIRGYKRVYVGMRGYKSLYMGMRGYTRLYMGMRGYATV